MCLHTRPSASAHRLAFRLPSIGLTQLVKQQIASQSRRGRLWRNDSMTSAHHRLQLHPWLLQTRGLVLRRTCS